MRLIAACVLLLTSCTVQSTTTLNTEMAKLASVTLADINAAAADAGAHGDVLAVACYPRLADWIITMQQSHGQIVPPAGGLSAFQQGRDVLKGGMSGIPIGVKIGCAALYLDVQGDVLRFVTLLATIAGGHFVPPPVVNP